MFKYFAKLQFIFDLRMLCDKKDEFRGKRLAIGSGVILFEKKLLFLVFVIAIFR